MGYITSERVAEIRAQIKKEFPDYKFSITRRHHSGVDIVIFEGPIAIDLKDGRTYAHINTGWVHEHYEGQPTFIALIQRIREIANEGVSYHETGDYGTQPSHYLWVRVGEYNKPYVQVKKQKTTKLYNSPAPSTSIDRSKPRFMNSRFSSTCKETGIRIQKDEPILYDPSEKRAYHSSSNRYKNEYKNENA